MTVTDYDTFAEVLVGFAELKGRQLSAPAIELYFRALNDWSVEDFRAAAVYLLRSCPFVNGNIKLTPFSPDSAR